MRGRTSQTLRLGRLAMAATSAAFVAAACGGGSLRGAGEGQIPNNSGFASESTYGSSDTDINRILIVRKRGDLVQFVPEGSQTAFVTAKLQGDDHLTFAYQGKLYDFDYQSGNFDDGAELQAGSNAGSKLVSGTLSPGSTVGLQTVTVGQDTGPYMLTVHGASQLEDDAADYTLAPCGSLDCADQPSAGDQYTVKTGDGRIIDDSLVLKTQAVRDDGSTDFLLTRKTQVALASSDDSDWSSAADQNGSSGLWDDYEPLPEILPSYTDGDSSSASSSQSDDDGGLFGWVSDLFTWKNLAIVAGIAIGAGILYEGLDYLTDGSWTGGDGKFFRWGSGPDAKSVGKPCSTGSQTGTFVYTADRSGLVCQPTGSSSSSAQEWAGPPMTGWE